MLRTDEIDLIVSRFKSGESLYYRTENDLDGILIRKIVHIDDDNKIYFENGDVFPMIYLQPPDIIQITWACLKYK